MKDIRQIQQATLVVRAVNVMMHNLVQHPLLFGKLNIKFQRLSEDSKAKITEIVSRHMTDADAASVLAILTIESEPING
jgi:hypothetical protein